MAAMTLSLQKALLDHVLGITTFTMPSAIHLALHTADPGDAGSTANEVSTSGTGYSRQNLTGKMSATDLFSGTSSLNVAVTFGPALSNWGTITHASLHDQSGSMLLFGALATAIPVLNGEPFPLDAGQFSITFR